MAALENVLQKHEKYLPDIKELELQEVLRVYQVYLPAIQLKREHVAMLMLFYAEEFGFCSYNY